MLIKKTVMTLISLVMLSTVNIGYATPNDYIKMPFDERLKLAEQGDAVTQFNVGILALFGFLPNSYNKDENEKNSLKWLERAANQQNRSAIVFLCKMNHKRSPQIPELIHQGQQGDQESIITLSLLGANSSCLTENEKTIVKGWNDNVVNYYQQQAQSGSENALMALAFIYLDGNYLTNDEQKGWQIIEKLANQNYPLAMMMYDKHNDSNDEAQSNTYYKKIFNLLRDKVKANTARPEELALLGVFYSGISDAVPPDTDKSNILLKLALISTTELTEQNNHELSSEWLFFANWGFKDSAGTPEHENVLQRAIACQKKMTSACY